MPSLGRITCSLLIDDEPAQESHVSSPPFPNSIGCVVGSDVGKRLTIVVEDREARARSGMLRTQIHVSIDGHTMPGCTIPLNSSKAVIDGVPCTADAKHWRRFVFTDLAQTYPAPVPKPHHGTHGRIVVQVSFGMPIIALSDVEPELCLCYVGSAPVVNIFAGSNTHQVSLAVPETRSGTNWMEMQRDPEQPVFTFVFTYLPSIMVTNFSHYVRRLLLIPPFDFPPMNEKEERILGMVTPLPSHLGLDSKIFTITHNF